MPTHKRQSREKTPATGRKTRTRTAVQEPPREDPAGQDLARHDLARELREHGLRATGPRLAVLAHLRSDLSHPTPETVHAALRREHVSLSLSTVYETLEAFLQAGLCRRVATRTKRLRVDGTADDHDHAVCRSCGEILDLERSPTFRATRPADLPRGAELIGCRIEYEVICAQCRKG